MAKGQSGLEYLFLVGIFLVALTPIFVYSIDTTYLSIRTSQSKEAVQTIAATADNLYKLGGGKTTIFVTFPSGINSTTIANKTVNIRLNIAGGVGDASAVTEATVNGSLPTSEGLKKITLEVVGSTVQVSG